MNENSTPTPTDESLKESSKKGKVSGIPRRTFVKLGLLGLGLGLAAQAARIIGAHPDFPEKVLQSISSGKAIEDIQEIISSRLHLEDQSYPSILNEAESKYQLEPWMTQVAKSVEILEVSRNQKVRPFLLFDITDTTHVIQATKREGVMPGNVLTTKYYDLGDSLSHQHALTIPYPQFKFPAQVDGQVSRFLVSSMYAWSENQQEHSTLVKSSNLRGGVILNKNGVLRVTTPEEFAEIHNNHRESIEAAMEFAFILDSEHLQDSFDTMENASSTLLKSIIQTLHSNTVITVHKNDGSFQTFLLASFQTEAQIKNNLVDDEALYMTPGQLAAIAEQLKQRVNGERFTLCIGDPSPESSNCYSPRQFSRSELSHNGLDVGDNTIEDWMQVLGVDERYFRIVGGVYNFAFPGISFPWVLATKTS